MQRGGGGDELCGIEEEFEAGVSSAVVTGGQVSRSASLPASIISVVAAAAAVVIVSTNRVSKETHNEVVGWIRQGLNCKG